MRRYYWVIETTLLLLLLQKLLIVSYSVLGYWIGVSLLLVASYYREGARPYTPILLLAICADFLEFKTVNRCLLAIMGTLMIWISFYKIDVPNKGEFEAGHRYFSWKGIPLSVFYPSDIFGRNVNWIPSKCYNHVLYDIFYVDPRVPRIPFWLFNYLTSFVHTLRMPVYSQTPLKLKDSQATVVIFSHGLGSNMNGHSSMCSWWASNGYIVISLQHFSDNVRIGPTSWEDSKTIL